MTHKLLKIGFAWVCIVTSVHAAELVPLEHFARLPDYSQPKISPTGKYLAFIKPVDGQNSLVIIRLSAERVSSVLKFERDAEVLDFHWANDDRIVCSFGRKILGKRALVRSAGEVFAMDANGKKKKSIFGYRAGIVSRKDSRIAEAKPIKAAGVVIDPLRDDRSNVLIAAYAFAGDREVDYVPADVAPNIYKVNLYHGARKRQNPVPYRSFNHKTDGEGRIRAANFIDRELNTTILYRGANEIELRTIEDLSSSKMDVLLLGIDAAGERIYVADSRDGKPRGVSLYDTRTGTFEQLWSHDIYDVRDLVWSADEKSVIGVTYYSDKLNYSFFDNGHPESRLIRSVQNTFKEKEIEIVSRTRDGTKSIIRVGTASEPADFYVFDSKRKNMNLLLGSRTWIDTTRTSSPQYFEITARDGEILRGYVTIPAYTDGKKLPFVVLPHGGPQGVRDGFRFDPDVQLLASRGYGVLQVNFRGSGGYGPTFEKAGYRKWGTTIQDDIADATNWVIDEGYADAERICINGKEFGAYSALMGAIRYPDLYKCAVGESGIYDLPLLYKVGEISDKNTGIDYLRSAIGTDQSELIRQSPSHNVDDIKADLLVSYAKLDGTSPPDQSIALTKALDNAGKKFELLVVLDEGDSIISESTQTERYSRLLEFLDKNIGDAATSN